MARILTDEASIADLVRRIRRVAVLGIKTDAQHDQPGYYVPKYLHDVGIEVVPVPVYYPEATMILGKPVVRKVADVTGPIDLLNVFRRARDLEAHFEDIVAKRPPAVWLQQGIKNEKFALSLVAEGIDVVQDACLMVLHRRYAR